MIFIKRHLSVILIFCALLSLFSYAVMADSEIKVYVNGKELAFDSSPRIDNGSTLVPMRGIFEALNAKVSWEEDSRTVVALRGDTVIRLKPGEKTFSLNGNNVVLNTPAVIESGRTLVPLRAIAEGLDCNVLWDGKTRTVSISENKPMKVHFIDCGQADCEFIELPDGKCMLIDSGEAAFGGKLTQYIKKLGYTGIDYVVATHPHADHIGGMAAVLKAFPVGVFYLPERSYTTKTFEKMLDALEENGCPAEYIYAGKIIFSGDVSCTAAAPVRNDYARINNVSAVIKMRYNNVSLLFCGDAEYDAETDILASGADIKCDVIKIGHHGSDTSSSAEFIEKAAPAAAVISVGRDNSYGFPVPVILQRLESMSIDIFRTDLSGDIEMETDGYFFSIQ